MIDHDRALELAAASIDFGLSAADDIALTDHLAECADCRTTVSGLRADAAALRNLEGTDAPARLRERVLRAAEATAVARGDASTEPGRAGVLRFPTRVPRPAALAAAAAIVIAVVGGTLWWRGASTPDGVAVVQPSSRPMPSQSGAPTAPGAAPTGGPSDELVTAGPQLAQLTAEDETGGVVPLDSSFALAALGGRSASELAESISVQPTIEMTTSVEPDGRVRLTPREPLTPGVVYRFTLTAPDGSASDSWAFQARQAVQVVSTLPGDGETEVPLGTGIEVTFDQDGVVGAKDHFTIAPAVDGRFEQHGRVLSFVPDRRLRPATIYTVTITRGVTVEATGEPLEQDFRFRFETAAARGAASPSSYLRFSNDLFESATADRPVVGMWWFDDSGEEARAPARARLDVYRYPDRAAAIAAFQTLRELPRWSRWNGAERLPATGLTRVARINARLRDANGTLWTTLPDRLKAGWYLVEHPDDDTPAQAILQVTDLSAYAAVSERKSLVWANDVATRRPSNGATVELDGRTVGRTDRNGLLVIDSPSAWLPSGSRTCTERCTPIITITAGADSAFVPATGAASPGGMEGGDLWWGGSANARYWILFDTDRSRYRRSDTINAWGMVRERETGTVPAEVQVRLTPGDESSTPPIVIASGKPRATGAFTTSLVLEDVPEGSYQLELSVAGEVISTRYVQVERILKPAYRIDVTTGRRVYVDGDRVRVTATARFFEGTPVPRVPIKLDGDLQGSATTDASGAAIIRAIARWGEADEPREHPRQAGIMAWPARAEEGDGQIGSREFVIFPSHWLVGGEASLQGRRLRISGSANELDRERVEREVSSGLSIWDLDPRGKGLEGRTVRARIVEEVPRRIQIGTSYDFVEKRVVPIYDYDGRDRVVTTLRLRTGSQGRFTASVAIPDARHTYRVELGITDPDGLRSAATLYVYTDDETYGYDRAPSLRPTADPEGDDSEGTVVGIGETVDLTMHEPDATDPVADDRHLFFAAQGGIRQATIHTSDRIVERFPDWGPPNVAYHAVRFTGSGYVTASPHDVSFRVADRAMTVRLSADRARYAPGQTARLSVTTLGADGRPMAATVIVRAVDEKLYAVGGAEDVDPLTTLYEHVDAGVVATYATHRGPNPRPEGADTGGGDTDGEKDTILFRAIDTDASGRATIDVPLPDDLTSWHITAAAIGDGLEAGGAVTMLPVGLPFFVATSIAPEYLAADRPVLQIRGFGSALAEGSRVTFSVDSETLGLHERGLTAPAFRAVSVPLPKLTVGRHRVTIAAQSGRGTSLLRYVVTRSFTVVPSRLTRTRTTYTEPTAPSSIAADADVLEVVVTDVGVGRLMPVLYELAGNRSARLEAALAQDVAAGVLLERFGEDASTVGANTFEGATYQRSDGGLAILPYGASDLEVSAVAAIVAPERFGGAGLRSYLRGVANASDTTRERRNLALAGLAGLGSAGLPAIRTALAEDGLTVRERLVLAIGAARLGDAATARRIAGELADAYGERLGPEARLRVGTGNLDDTTASALMAMLLASYGDPVAPRYRAYVAANETDPTTLALPAVAYARWMADHVASAPTRFAYVLDGRRTEVDLAAGEAYRLLLPRAMRRGFSIEPLDGALGVTATWREAANLDAIDEDPDIDITRRVRPAGVIDESDLVVVDLRVTFGPHAPAACHRVVDLVPSGLVPITTRRASVDDEDAVLPVGISYPESQVGQRVVFCAEPTARRRTVTLRYLARVISTGTYRWEPALAESRTEADRAAVVAARTIRIR